MGLTRDQFRNGVFERDQHLCVMPGCLEGAVDAHHVVERATWLKSDPHPEGYLLENGASLCEKHHRQAEANAFPPQALRRTLGLPTVLPAQLDPDKLWDKWGEEIPRVESRKYPRTPYLSISPEIDPNDGTVPVSTMTGKPLVVTPKFDGSNVTLTREKVAARNGDTADAASFSMLKARHAAFRHHIPEGVALHGEWLYARHTIAYDEKFPLQDHLVIFGASHFESQLVLGWGEVTELARRAGLLLAPVQKAFDEDIPEWRLSSEIYTLFEVAILAGHEGIVVRNAHPFHLGQFADNVSKMVREGFRPGESFGGRLVKNVVANQTR